MTMRVLKACAVALLILTPAAAMAQSKSGSAVGGAAAGAATGAVGGAIVGGPVGAVVGGAAGAVIGGTAGGISADDRVYVKHYVVEEKRYPSVRMQDDVEVGTVLPPDMTYYEIQGRPHVSDYRYAVVNDNVVVVEPRSHKVVEVLD